VLRWLLLWASPPPARAQAAWRNAHPGACEQDTRLGHVSEERAGKEWDAPV